MASEWETALKNAAGKVAQYVNDVATLTVETRLVEIGAAGSVDFDKAAPAARTIIKLDGDSEAAIPMRKNDAGVLEMDTVLFDLHQQNVNTAIEYRARMLSALLEAIRSTRG